MLHRMAAILLDYFDLGLRMMEEFLFGKSPFVVIEGKESGENKYWLLNHLQHMLPAYMALARTNSHTQA